MNAHYAPRSRSERLIAGVRVVLAASSLFAVWLDPSEPAKYAGIAYSLLAAYLAYSMILALLVWRLEAPFERWRLVSHLFDLGFFSLFVYFTSGPGSPFTAYFVFSLVCATLRWGPRGTLWTAVFAVGTFLGIGVYVGEVLKDPDFQLHRSIIRGVYLAVLGVLLGYLGAHEAKTRREMSALAAWPQRVPGEPEELVREILRQAVLVLEAPRAVLAWVEREEPWLHLASWDGSRLATERAPARDLEPLVAPALAASSFFCHDLGAGRWAARLARPEGIGRFRGVPFHGDLARRLAARAVLAVPLAGETVEGRLFVCDREAMTADDLVLGEVVAAVATARLDHFHLLQRLREVAATEERIRLARDLHDGVLQSFTGIALRLAAARRRFEEAPAAALQALEDVQRLITLEQRDLRFFIEELKPALGGTSGAARSLAERLGELAERVEREWDRRVELEARGLDARLPDAVGREVYHLVREGLINAIRHGDASEMRVTVEALPGGRLRIAICDNGSGFAFEGTRTGDELAAGNAGPRTLRERVTALGGSLAIESSREGARVVAELPLA
jgi:signal transduction histidine kinase